MELNEQECLERLGGDHELHVRLVQVYLRELPRYKSMLDEVPADSGWHELSKTAHHIKGASATIGLSELAHLCKNLEIEAKQLPADASAKQGEAVSALRRSVREGLEQAQPILEQWLASKAQST